MRNSLPRAFAMCTGVDTPFSFEYYTLKEGQNFNPTLKERLTAPSYPGRQNDLLIKASRDSVTLGLRWDPWIGQPLRRDRPAVLTIKPGQTARLIINGRLTTYHGQTYTEATYNVAYAEYLPPDVFTSAAPTVVFDMRAHLF